jgi:hypothetical protein
MSRLWVEGPEPHWVTYTERVVCDGCEKVTLERNHGPDHRERPFLTDESGGATFTRARGTTEDAEGLVIDFCEACASVVEDLIRERLKRTPVTKTLHQTECERCGGAGHPTGLARGLAQHLLRCPGCGGSGVEKSDFSKEPL